jgi:hypothetical protein
MARRWESFVRFHRVHHFFNVHLIPRKGQSRSACVVIPFNANDDTVEFFHLTLTSMLHPAIAFLRPSFTKHPGTPAATYVQAFLLECCLEAASGLFFHLQ